MGFLFLASCIRAALLLASPWEVYHLDGPVGGALNMACEICAVPLTAWLCRPLWRNFYSLGRVLAVMVMCGVFASQQHLATGLQMCGSQVIGCHPQVISQLLAALKELDQFSGATLPFMDAAVAVTFFYRTCSLWTKARGEFMVYSVMALLFQQHRGPAMRRGDEESKQLGPRLANDHRKFTVGL
eukprot:Skav212852  [mRNA]  locus=scaffold786:15666:24360:+ [translate_table: standard]